MLDEEFRKNMQSVTQKEKGHGRIETRTAYVTHDIKWLDQKKDWKNICCIGAVNTKFETSENISDEWHYYISSKELSADELLHHARMEWSVETMHWLLDVHFDEDWCRVEDKNVQQNLNIFRKCAINLIKLFKSETSSKKPISNIMFDCLLDFQALLQIINRN